MCSGMSSFGFICRSLLPFISRATFFISSCFGLSRKRIFHSLKTPNVFRTFQEPQVAMTECSLSDEYLVSTKAPTTREEDNNYNGNKAHNLSIEQQSANQIVKRCPNIRNMIFLLENYYALRGMKHTVARKKSINSLLGKNMDLIVQEEMPYQGMNQFRSNNSFRSSLRSRVDSFRSLGLLIETEEEDEEENSIKLAIKEEEESKKKEADYKINRIVFGAKPMNTVNVNTSAGALNFQSSDLSNETLSSTSMDIPPPFLASLSPHKKKNESATKKKEKKDRKEKNGPPELIAAQVLLQEQVAGPFQKHLSKFIRVTDIPRGDDINKIDPLKKENDLKKQIINQGKEMKLMQAEDIDIFIDTAQEEEEDTYTSYGQRKGVYDESYEGKNGNKDYSTRLSVNFAPTLYDSPDLTIKNLMNNLHDKFSPDGSFASYRSASSVVQSQYDAKREHLMMIRLLGKKKILEGLDNAPKTKEPIGVAMHSDEALLKIFSLDSIYYEDETNDENVDDENDKERRESKKLSKKKKLRHAKLLVALLAEIDAAEEYYNDSEPLV